MNKKLPETFVNRMRQQLGEELTAFLHALDEEPSRGIRINTLRQSDATAGYTTGDAVPWARDAYYLPVSSDAGSTVLHEAGAFYLQDPGAMLPAAVLGAQPGERILDLCAAPGGKSTQIGCDMRGEGLLVCNEPVPKRAQILSGNIERIGLPHTVVTCAYPEQLAGQWGSCFDAVLVDAPCSGEGMFRKEPKTRSEWSEGKAAGCAERQRGILEQAAMLVRPGGRLVYSTCTYNPDENEGNVKWFLQMYPDFTIEAFHLPGIDAPDGMYTCYPQRLRCEGQFVAMLRKTGNGGQDIARDRSLRSVSKEERKTFCGLFPGLPEPTHMIGNMLVRIPECPDLERIRTFRIGLHLGEIRGKVFVPDHAAALCFRQPEIQAYDLSQEEAVKYIAGETVNAETDGWVILRYCGLVLGWGKGSGGIIRNHYPKGLRKLHVCA